MKIYLILLLSLILMVPLTGQVRFLEPDTAVWRLRGIVTPGACLLVDYQFMLSRQDTTVGNHLYRKVFFLGINGTYLADCKLPPMESVYIPSHVPKLVSLIREDSSKVYYLSLQGSPPFDHEHLSYDFSQQVGDTTVYYQDRPANYNKKISEVGEIEILNRQHKFQRIPILPRADTLIEGIGSIRYPYFFDFLTNIPLVCYSRNDTLAFSRAANCSFFIPETVTAVNQPGPSGHSKIFPNPTDGIINISLTDPQIKIAGIFNVIGSKVIPHTLTSYGDLIQVDISNLPNGVYFLVLKNIYGKFEYRKINLLH